MGCRLAAPRHEPLYRGHEPVTQHIGFGLTYSSTFLPPFYVARLLNSLDHVTGGRIAFNVIASSRRADAANYGFDDLMDHDDRYGRMEEFMEVCNRLWESFAPDRLIWDRETGVVADSSKVAAINHKGKFFSVKGPLASVPSPQVKPVVVQAGASPRGIQASATFADMIFAANHDMGKRKKHRADLDAALVAQGRDPSRVGIVWDEVLIVGETTEDARRRHAHLLNAVPFEAVGAFMSHQIGYDLSKLPERFHHR